MRNERVVEVAVPDRALRAGHACRSDGPGDWLASASGEVSRELGAGSASGASDAPLHAFLTAKDVMARYGWGRTKGYQMLRSRGFPRPVGRDRYRLDSIMAWEDAQIKDVVITVPSLPPRKRKGSNAMTT